MTASTVTHLIVGVVGCLGLWFMGYRAGREAQRREYELGRWLADHERRQSSREGGAL